MSEQQVVDYNVTDAAIAELKQASQTVVEEVGEVALGTGAQYELVKNIEAPIRQIRGRVESHRKLLKADALAWGRKVDGEAKRITEALLAAEKPVKALRLKWDEAKAKIKAEKEALAAARMEYIMAALDWMKLEPWSFQGLGLIQLEQKAEEYSTIELGDNWQEFLPQAVAAQSKLMDEVNKAINNETVRLNEEAAMLAEKERLANEKAKFEAEQAVARREAAEAAEKHKAQLAEEEATRQQLANEMAEAKANMAKQQALIEEAQAKLKAEQKAAEEEAMAVAKAEAEVAAQKEAQKAGEAAEAKIAERADCPAVPLMTGAGAAIPEVEMPFNEKLRDFATSVENHFYGEKPVASNEIESQLLSLWRIDMDHLIAKWRAEL